MTNAVLPSLKKICLEPGVLFPIGNIFVFAQADNKLALGFAIINALFSAYATLRPIQKLSPLRITMWMVLLSALCSFWSGDLLPGLTGFMFAIGHFMITNDKIRAMLVNPSTHSTLKIIIHPAIYYGLGSVIAGVMAGGGMALLTHPFTNLNALIMVSVGAITIIAASLGLALRLMQSAIPFWILASGSAITGVAGIFSGNWLGVTNCFFSTLGGYRLGVITHQTSQHKE
jgi:hypothetical protein